MALQLRVIIHPHPLIQHWLGIARQVEKPSALFKSAIANSHGFFTAFINNNQRNCGLTIPTYDIMNHKIFLRLREPKRWRSLPEVIDGSMPNADDPRLSIWKTLKQTIGSGQYVVCHFKGSGFDIVGEAAP